MLKFMVVRRMVAAVEKREVLLYIETPPPNSGNWVTLDWILEIDYQGSPIEETIERLKKVGFEIIEIEQ